MKSSPENPSAPPGPGLKQAARRGLGIAGAAQIASQVGSIVLLGALLRLVSPDDFAIVQRVLPLVVILRVFVTLGLNLATIQLPNLSDRQLSTVFWINLAAGAVTMLVTAALAPAVAAFYQLPALKMVTVAISGSSLLVAASSVYQALLDRRLQFAPVAAARLAGQLGGTAVAIGVAITGGGVLALVVQQYAEPLIVGVICYANTHWRPSWPMRGERVPGLWHFGSHLTLATTAFQYLLNADTVLVGRLYRGATVGLYGQAYNAMMKPVYAVVNPVTAIMLPVLARAQEDRAAHREIALALLRMMGGLGLPAGVGLAIVAPEAMRVLGGAQWADAGPLLRALSPVVLVHSSLNAAGSLLIAAGRTRRLAQMYLAWAVVLTIALAIGAALDSRQPIPALAIATAYSATTCLVFFPFMSAALRAVEVPFAAWLKQFSRTALAALAMGVVVSGVHLAQHRLFLLPPAPLLAVEILLGLAAYAIFARGEVEWLLAQLRQWRAGRAA